MISGILILKGDLELLSAAHIGSGQTDYSHMDVLLDHDEQPFIPATSLAGVLRQAARERFEKEHKAFFNKFWGFWEDETGCQSALHCSDCLINKEYKSHEVSIRDGVSIDKDKGLAADKKKYDYQIIEPGIRFGLFIETVLKTSCDDKNQEIANSEFNEFSSNIMFFLKALLESGELRIGGRTGTGLGRVKLYNAKLYEFDFNKKDHVVYWLKKEFPDSLMIKQEENISPLPPQTFKLTADFMIKHSFIIRANPALPSQPDSVSLQSDGHFIISGSSLRGAIRSRLEKILNTVSPEGPKIQELIDSLFGYVRTDKTEDYENSGRGRILVDEIRIPDPTDKLTEKTAKAPYVPEQQTRIKIDRFTGGTIEGAMLETMPVFSDGKKRPDKLFQMQIQIRNCRSYEAGLILLILKDLWAGDLPIGGEKSIGRGTLQGFKAQIEWEESKVLIEDKDDELIYSDEGRLNSWIKLLDQFLNGDSSHG